MSGSDLRDLIARGDFTQAIEALRQQFEKRPPSDAMRLQLADLLLRAGREGEAVPIFFALAEQHLADGFVTKAVAILKRLQKVDSARAEAESRLAALAQQPKSAPTTSASPATISMRPVMFGMEEIGEAEEIGFASSPAAPAPATPEPASEQAPAPAAPEPGAEAAQPPAEAAAPEPAPAPASAEAAAEPTPASPESFHDRVLDLVGDVLRQAPRPEEAKPRPAAVAPTLATNPLLAGFSEEERIAVLRELRLLTYEPGDVILTQGEPGNSLFLLAAGLVRVFARGDGGRSLPLRVMSEGTFFGEISLISGRPRSAMVTAATHCELLELDRPTVDRLTVTHPHVMEVIEEFYVSRAGGAPDSAPAAAAGAEEPADEEVDAGLRARLREAAALVSAGRHQDALPVLLGVVDDLAREGFPEKAIALLKKIDIIRRGGSTSLALTAVRRGGGAAAGGDAGGESFGGFLSDFMREEGAPAAPEASPQRRLAAHPLFTEVTEEELSALVDSLGLLSLEPGDVALTEGEPGSSLLVLTSGELKVFQREESGRSRFVRHMVDGEFVGERALLSGEPRSATVVAASRCELLVLDRAGLDRLAATQPRIRTILEEHSQAHGGDDVARNG